MVRYDLNGYDEFEEIYFNDADKKIIKFLIKMIEEADKTSLINWNDFYKYCLEFGMINPPNILTIPIPVLDKCIKEARKRAKYSDELNKL